MIILLRCARTANRAKKLRAPTPRTVLSYRLWHSFRVRKTLEHSCNYPSVDPSITKESDFEITIGKYVPFAPRENYRQN
jgi:hypothetical protein